MLTNVINLSETFSIETATVKVMKADPKAVLPRKATEGSAAYDLFPLRPFTLHPNQRAAVVTGIHTQIPEGFYGQIMPRSGMSLDGINVIPGVID